VTNLPTWAVYLLSFGSPVLAFVGVLVGQRINLRAATQLEARSKREEVMRDLRWAAELAVSDDEGHARLGVAELRALGESDLLDDSEQLFIDAALNAVVNVPAREIEQLGGNVQVIATTSLPADAGAHLPSEAGAEDEEGDG
jgi:hypothetical protein